MLNIASLTLNLDQNLLLTCDFAWLIVEFAGHLKTVLWLSVSYLIKFCIEYHLLSFLVQAVTHYLFFSYLKYLSLYKMVFCVCHIDFKPCPK